MTNTTTKVDNNNKSVESIFGIFLFIILWLSLGAFLYAEQEEVGEVSSLKVERQRLRISSCPLDLPNNEFVKLFQLCKDAFTYVLEEIKEEFKPHKSGGLPAVLKLASTLRFLGEGSYQKGVGQDYHIGMAQPTLSKVLSETLEIIERKLCPKMITF